MRYQVREVTEFHPRHISTVFAVPTVLDQPFYNVFCPAPIGAAGGHAADLDEGGGELVAEVIHARIDYQPRHWVRVGVMQGNRFADQDINGLREGIWTACGAVADALTLAAIVNRVLSR